MLPTNFPELVGVELSSITSVSLFLPWVRQRSLESKVCGIIQITEISQYGLPQEHVALRVLATPFAEQPDHPWNLQMDSLSSASGFRAAG